MWRVELSSTYPFLRMRRLGGGGAGGGRAGSTVLLCQGRGRFARHGCLFFCRGTAPREAEACFASRCARTKDEARGDENVVLITMIRFTRVQACGRYHKIYLLRSDGRAIVGRETESVIVGAGLGDLCLAIVVGRRTVVCPRMMIGGGEGVGHGKLESAREGQGREPTDGRGESVQ